MFERGLAPPALHVHPLTGVSCKNWQQEVTQRRLAGLPDSPLPVPGTLNTVLIRHNQLLRLAEPDLRLFLLVSLQNQVMCEGVLR